MARTPATLVLGVGLKNIILSAWVIWSTTFIISRVHHFHEVYIEEANKRSNEKWLLKQCSDPEFFSNMKQHADALCSKVENNARASIFLRSLHKVAASTYICGSSSCVEMACSFVSRFGWQATLMAAILMMVAPNLLLGILRLVFCMYQQPASNQNNYLHDYDEDDANHNYYLKNGYDDAHCDYSYPIYNSHHHESGMMMTMKQDRNLRMRIMQSNNNKKDVHMI